MTAQEMLNAGMTLGFIAGLVVGIFGSWCVAINLFWGTRK
jgi:hypothetical protein